MLIVKLIINFWRQLRRTTEIPAGSECLDKPVAPERLNEIKRLFGQYADFIEECRLDRPEANVMFPRQNYLRLKPAPSLNGLLEFVFRFCPGVEFLRQEGPSASWYDLWFRDADLLAMLDAKLRLKGFVSERRKDLSGAMLARAGWTPFQIAIARWQLAHYDQLHKIGH